VPQPPQVRHRLGWCVGRQSADGALPADAALGADATL
jgi:hypothetical protein